MKKSINQQAENLSEELMKLYRELTFSKKEFVISKRILLSGTCMIHRLKEMQNARNLTAKINGHTMTIKKAAETSNWLKLLFKKGYLDSEKFDFLNRETMEFTDMLMKSENDFQNQVRNFPVNKN